MRRLLAGLLLCVVGSSVFAEDYYATQTGAGSANGTSGNPWSISSYNGSSTPSGGDTVYFTGTITSKVIPGTSGSGNGAGRLILDFSGATLSGGIGLKNDSYLTLLGGTLAANSSELISHTTLIGDVAHDITIDGFTFTGLADGYKRLVEVGYLSELTIQNNYVDNGVLLKAGQPTDNLVVRNNYARSSANASTQIDVVTFAGTVGLILEGNKLINRAPGTSENSRHNDVIQCYQNGSGTPRRPSDFTIRYNWIETDVGANADTGGAHNGANSWMMMESLDGTNKIYGNVFVGDTGANTTRATNGATFFYAASSAVFYHYNNTYANRNNTPGNTIRFGIGTPTRPGTLYSANNTGTAPGQTSTTMEWDMTRASVDSNFFFEFGNCAAQFTGPNGSCSTDPEFTDFDGEDFSLSAASALIGAGDTLAAEYNQGIAPGATWPNPTLATRTGNWDVGAFVFPAGEPGDPAPPNPISGLSVVEFE